MWYNLRNSACSWTSRPVQDPWTISSMCPRRPLADKILIPLPPPNLKSSDNGRQWKYLPDHTFFQRSLGKEGVASCWKSQCNPTTLLPRAVSYQPPNYLNLKVLYHGSWGWGVILIQADIGIQRFAIWNNMGLQHLAYQFVAWTLNLLRQLIVISSLTHHRRRWQLFISLE